MAAILRKPRNRNASRTSFLIAFGVHLVIFLLFWNRGTIMKKGGEFIEIFTPNADLPQKPPSTTIKSPVMVSPPNTRVIFDVKTAPQSDPGFTIKYREIPASDQEYTMPDFSKIARDPNRHPARFDNLKDFNVVTKIMEALNIPSLFENGRSTMVSETGKRMRARLNLCVLSTPGSTVLGKIGRNLGGGITDTSTFALKIGWDYVFRKYQSIEYARAWLSENTRIQVTRSTVTLDFERTYGDWVADVRKKGAAAPDAGSQSFEDKALRTMEQAVDALAHDRFAGRRGFVRLMKTAVFAYLADRYGIRDAETLPADMLISRIEERTLLREWRKRGLAGILASVSALDPGAPEDALLSAAHPVYLFFRQAQALENPLILVSNIVGLNKIPRENMDLLRHYVKNGGFCWIDDPGVASENVNNLDNLARGFIHELMAFDETGELTSREQETLRRLSKDDRSVQGCGLGDPFPAFAHPQCFIPIALAQDAPVVLTLFNRLGLEVKRFAWTRERPMRAGAYTSRERALAWNCDNNDGEPVESGCYFVRMESGLFQKTRVIQVGRLRQLDEKHPVLGVVHGFRRIPVCTIESGSTYWVNRPYGNSAFGYYLNGRMCLLYTEGAGLMAGLGDLANPVGMDRAGKFLNNVIAFALSDEDGVAIRP